MDKRIIQPKGMAEAVGPFSRAVLIGDHLHIAGTTALSHVSGDYYDRSVPGTIEEQTRLTLDNIQKCVEAAGGNMGDIFKVVIMLKNPADYKRMNAIRAEYFPRDSADQHLFPRRSHAGRHSRRDRGGSLHSEPQRRSSDMKWYQTGSARSLLRCT